MSRMKASAIALGVVLVVLAILPFRTPIRKAWRHSHARHEPSKGTLKTPEAMAFGKDGRIYVGNQDSGDSDNHLLQVFTADGKYLKTVQ